MGSLPCYDDKKREAAGAADVSESPAVIHLHSPSGCTVGIISGLVGMDAHLEEPPALPGLSRTTLGGGEANLQRLDSHRDQTFLQLLS